MVAVRTRDRVSLSTRMNDAEKSKLEERLKQAGPLLIAKLSGPSVLPDRVKAALSSALEKKFPLARELTEKQMEGLLLKLIAEQRSSGFDLVDSVIKARFRVGQEGEGAIFALLAGMEERELIQGEWREGGRRMIKTYRLTPNGRKQVEKRPAFAAELTVWVEAILRKA